MEQVGQSVVDGEATCFECLYDLRGQPADGRCPECGLPVAASTREDRWDRADARWRRRVRRGLVWSAGEYGVLATAVAVGLASPDGEWIGPVMLALIGVAGVVGGWKVTAAEPAAPHGRSRGRWAVRWLTAATGLACAAVVAAAIWTWDDVEVGGVPLGTATAAAWFGLNGAKQAALAWYARRLLARVPGRPLRRSASLWVAAPLVGWWGFVVILVVDRLFLMTNFGWRVTVAMLLVVLVAFVVTSVFDLVAWRVLRRGRR